MDDTLHAAIALGVKHTGIGIPDLVALALHCHAALETATQVLTKSLLEGQEMSWVAHQAQVSHGRNQSKTDKGKQEMAALTTTVEAATSRDKARLGRARRTGAWLTVLPDAMNCTELLAEEFRDSLSLRCGLTPAALPEKCNGCGTRFSVDHALTCKKGGLILLCHNDVAGEWHSQCAAALTPSAVSDEPLINSGRAAGEGAGNVTAADATTEVPGWVEEDGREL